MESFLQNRPALATASHYTLQPPVEPGFQPFLRPTLASEEEASTGAREPSGARSAAEQNEPQIELVNREGSVERIVITCTCCQRIELQCEY
ncbi:MAG TPA: hypothetical protein VH207_07535 [Chthoniobacterales bacterium]|jgi:hypothetical protein|nr:hypothetical protein [Chthoniobacterales bacterium]